jgi:hypothetical protein
VAGEFGDLVTDGVGFLDARDACAVIIVGKECLHLVTQRNRARAGDQITSIFTNCI